MNHHLSVENGLAPTESGLVNGVLGAAIKGIQVSMKLEILGQEGAKFDRLHQLAFQVAGDLKRAVEIKVIHDTSEIVRRGVSWTPALIVNGEIKCAGRLPSKAELRAYLS